MTEQPCRHSTVFSMDCYPPILICDRCGETLSDKPYEPSGLDEFAPETTHNPSTLPVLSLFEEEQ